MIVILYHPEFDRIELWDDTDIYYTPQDRQEYRSIWRRLEFALELGWEVVGTL